VVKYVLHRRGLIGSPRFRDTNPPLDDYDRQELDTLIDDLGDIMVVSAAVAEGA
jgi:hypothetical protein